MKLTKHNNQLKTNATNVQSQNFGIGDASVVIEILRNRLYKHKIRTMVQEYICNGRDAMREIDSSKDLVITAPTRLEPTFKVRDYGPGISPERMSSVFVLYGASTKRDTNNQTGGFGIGAKSAWSYTDSFTIITYIDGLRTTYVAHTGVNNNGRLDQIDQGHTSEVNGTEIQIAASPQDLSQFHEAIQRAVWLWDSGYKTVNLNKDTSRVKGVLFNNVLEALGRDSEYPPCLGMRYRSGSIANIDGVPYSLNGLSEKVESLNDLESLIRGSFILHVPNGYLDVSASREEISDSKATVNSLDKLCKKLIEDVNKKLSTEFSKATSPFDYINLFKELSKSYDVSSYCEYDKYIMNYGSINSDLFKDITFSLCYIDRNGRLIKTNKREQRRLDRYGIQENYFNHLYYALEESMVKRNKRIRKYLETNDRMLVIESQGSIEASFKKVVKDLGFESMDSIELVVEPKKPIVKVTRDKKEFCIHDYSEYRVNKINTTLEDNSTKWYYIEMNYNSVGMDKDDIRELANFLDINICGLAKSSVKLVAKDSNFKTLDSLINSHKPTKANIKQAKGYQAQNWGNFELFKTLTVKNKVLNSFIKEYNNLDNHDNNIPNLLKDVYTKNKDLQDFVSRDKILNKYIKANFLMIQEVGSYRVKRNKKDFEILIDAKTKIINGGK